MSISNLFYLPNDYKLHADSINITKRTDLTDPALIINGETVFNGSVNFSLTANATSESTGSLVVLGGAGIEQDLFVGGTLTATNIIYKAEEIVTNTADATSTSTGAMQIAGGTGIAKNLYVGGNSIISNNNTVYGNGTIIGSLFVGGNINGNLKTTTTESTSTNTGALQVLGGVGIAKSLYCNSINGTSLYLSNNTPSTDTLTGALSVVGGCAIGNNINVGGNATVLGALNAKSCVVSSTNNATDTNSGSVIIGGGASIAGDLYVGGSVIENNPRLPYLQSSDWYLLFTMSTSQNLNILARTESNQITQLLINNTNISSNINNFLINSMPRYLVYLTGSTYNVFIKAYSGTNLNTLYTDTALIQADYGAGAYPNGYTNNYVYDTSTDTGFATSDVMFFYNTSEANSTSTGALIVGGGIGCGGIYCGANGLTLSGGSGVMSTIYNDANGNLNIGSSASGLIITSSNTQMKIQRVDDISVSTLNNVPIYCYGGICSMKKMGCVEGYYVNPNLYGTTTTSDTIYGSLSVGAGNNSLELSNNNGGTNIRNPPKHTFFLYGDQYQPNYSTGSISSGNYVSASGDLAISNGILLNVGGATLSQLKYITGQYVDAGQVGSMSCYFKTNSNYSNPPTNSVNIMQLYGNSANGSNSITLYHYTTGYLKLKCIDSSGVTTFDVNLAVFNPSTSNNYYLSVDWDFTAGSTMAFVNGAQIGSTQTATATRTNSSYMIVNCPATASYTIEFLQIFRTKIHTTTYTPPTVTNYNLVTFPNTGGITLYSDISNLTSGTLTCSSGSGLLWNGSPIGGTFDPTQIQIFSNTANSTNSTTGALQVIGGVGVGKDVYLASTTASSNASTGSLIVCGGLATKKPCSFGDTVNIYNNSGSGAASSLSNDGSGNLDISVGAGVVIATVSSYQWFASLTTSLTADYSANGSSLSATTSGSVSISAGKLLMSASASTCYWASGGAGVDGTSSGCVNFKFTPLYSSSPSASVTMFELVNNTGNGNRLQLYHSTSRTIKLTIYDTGGIALVNTTILNPWNQVSGTEYEIELDWSPSATRLFINGSQVGSTITTDITDRSGTCSRIELDNGGGGSCAWRQVQLYTTPQHTANYTPVGVAGNVCTFNSNGLTVNNNLTVGGFIGGDALICSTATNNLGFFGTNHNTQQTITGSVGSDTATVLGNLITALANYGLIVNSTTA